MCVLPHFGLEGGASEIDTSEWIFVCFAVPAYPEGPWWGFSEEIEKCPEFCGSVFDGGSGEEKFVWCFFEILAYNFGAFGVFIFDHVRFIEDDDGYFSGFFAEACIGDDVCV